MQSAGAFKGRGGRGGEHARDEDEDDTRYKRMRTGAERPAEPSFSF